MIEPLGKDLTYFDKKYYALKHFVEKHAMLIYSIAYHVLLSTAFFLSLPLISIEQNTQTFFASIGIMFLFEELIDRIIKINKNKPRNRGNT